MLHSRRPTPWGISQRAYPDVDVRNLTREDALAIYRRDYWDALRCDELPDAVAIALFDFAVHSGPTLAVRALQRLVGTGADGRVGPKTVAAVLELEPHEIAIELMTERGRLIAPLVIRRPPLSRFLAGWIARLISLAALVGRIERNHA